ncbi:hypothetical protein [Algoriphagus sp.]|uniref:hypothetical protein n=1 Tax=Algoriphagus sp. TaxID=1872435 RepID=UPI0027198363|nr:hypothetical protein [Algoriphagus sp.]MDO8965058.1 hypothetical protein [Algoriphagus sp.]MDP3201867.1 hypothetical protein [Algoriphagus sp.]
MPVCRTGRPTAFFQEYSSHPAAWLIGGFVHQEIFLHSPVGTPHILASRFNGWI